MSAGDERPRVVILAAGRGSRLGALTDARPKPLQPLGETTLLGRLLAQCAARALHDVTVVAGYRSADIAAACGVARAAVPSSSDRDGAEPSARAASSAAPTVVVNTAWDIAGTGWSLLAGLASTAGIGRRPLLVLHGDVVLEDAVLDAVLDGPGDRAALDRSWQALTGDEVWASVDADGHLATLRKGAPSVLPSSATGEYVGALRLEPAGATRLAEHAAHRLGDEPDLDYEQPLLAEVLADLALAPVWCSAEQWRNVNDADDLAWARARFGGAPR